MAEPTDDQLRDYAAKLPQIYKDLLTTFPLFHPDRRFGDPVLRGRLEDYLISEDRDIRFDDVQTALDQLIAQKFIRNTNTPRFLSPTPLGERLISIITKHVPRPATIPELPQPSWA